MTTPSENVDNVTTRPGHLANYAYGGSSNGNLLNRTVLRIVNASWEKKLRPASGTSAFVGRFGWRPCRGWTHSGRHWIYQPNVVERLIQNPIGVGTRQVYEDGSFWGVAPPAVPAFPSSLINEAEIKALNKLKDQDINLGTFIAEFGETEKMIASHILKIAKDVRKWRRGNPPKLWKLIRGSEGPGYPSRVAADTAKRLPASWLELQYGWKPLLSDIYGGIHHLTKDQREPFIHVKGYAERKSAVSLTCSAVAGTSKAWLEFDLVQKVWVSLYYLLNNPGLAEQSSLGLLNPAEIVWECLPYSFVVDWIIPIGPWMSSLTADAGFTFQGGSCSRKSELNGGKLRNISLESIRAPTSSVSVTGSGPSLSGGAFDFARTCYLNSPVPGVYIKNPLSALHVANATALLIQAFR